MVLSTVLREGNFDYVTNQVHWDTTAQTIPASLYLTSKPAFFGSLPWPWVDPTGATKLHTLPAKARFEGTPLPLPQPLTVAKAGTGSGTVTSSPAGINCGADCTETYTTGTVVTLTATPAAGSTFTGWSGACTGTGTCQVTMNAAKSVTATFTLSSVTYTLTVAKAGTGTGTVTSSPAGISCGADCSEPYNSGTVVTLSQAATAGSTFTGWSGACTGTGACQVTMSAAKSVTATFTPESTHPHRNQGGHGHGHRHLLARRHQLWRRLLRALQLRYRRHSQPGRDAGSTFTGWSGACTGTGACQVTMSAAQSVTATFTLNHIHPDRGEGGYRNRNRHLFPRRHQLRRRLLRALQLRYRRHSQPGRDCRVHLHWLERCLHRNRRLPGHHERRQVRHRHLRP